MQITPMRHVSRALIAATVLAAIGFAVSAKPASAQSGNIPVPSQTSETSAGSFHGGVFLFQNHTTNDLVGIGYGGGLSLTIEQKPQVSRTQVSVDYITASKGGNYVHFIPVMVEYTQYQTPRGAIHPYLMYGAGYAYTTVKDSGNLALGGGSKSGSSVGFDLGYGFDTKAHIYAELRYIYAQSVFGVSASGPQLNVGIRL